MCHFTIITTTYEHKDNNLVLIGVTRHVPFGFIKALNIPRRANLYPITFENSHRSKNWCLLSISFAMSELVEYHDEQTSQSLHCQDAPRATRVIKEKGRQLDLSIEAIIDAQQDQYVTPTQHASVDKSRSRSNRRVSFGDTRRPLFKMGITPRGKDHMVRFKKQKKRRISQTEDGDEEYERSENAIVHVPKSPVNAIAKKIHTQVMGDVLQRMTPNQEYKKLVQRVEKLEQEPMESEYDKTIDHEQMEEQIRDIQRDGSNWGGGGWG